MGWGINLYDLVRIPIKKPCNGYYLRWYYNGWHYWFFLPGKHYAVTEGEKYRTIGTRKVAMGTANLTGGQTDAIRTIMFTREIALLTIAGWMNISIERDTLIIYDNQIAGAEIEFIAVIGSKEISYDSGYTPVPFIPVISPAIPYCEIIIGNQIWMCKNFDSKFPGSKVYNDDEANRLIYGGLYHFGMCMNPGFAPVGWHFPTLAEWQTLINYVGGDAIVGDVLKEIGLIHWNVPNAGTDTYGFKTLGAGYYFSNFNEIYETTNFWCKNTGIGMNPNYTIKFRHDNAAITKQNVNPNYYFSVRLIKDIPAPMPIPIGIIIGTQTWATRNWEYNYPGSRIYNDNEINRSVYGGLYSYAQCIASDFCPSGWHVPSMTEWNILITFLGGAGIAGNKLKEIGNVHWNVPSAGTDDVGFTALPGGNYEIVYSEMGNNVSFMSTTNIDAGSSEGKGILHNFGMVFDGSYCHPPGSVDTFYGSVRLIHD